MLHVEAVSAREARQLGAALISPTCNANGGFGNLITLAPLSSKQRPRRGRHNGCACLDPALGTSRPATGPSAG